jgi:hypothetical protein
MRLGHAAIHRHRLPCGGKGAIGIVLHQLLRRQADEVPHITLVARGERAVGLKRLIVLAQLLVTLRGRLEHGRVRVGLRGLDDALVLAGFEQLLHL